MTPIAWIRMLGLTLIGGAVGYASARARRRRADERLPIGGSMTMNTEIAPVDPPPMAHVITEETPCIAAHAKS